MAIADSEGVGHSSTSTYGAKTFAGKAGGAGQHATIVLHVSSHRPPRRGRPVPSRGVPRAIQVPDCRPGSPPPLGIGDGPCRSATIRRGATWGPSTTSDQHRCLEGLCLERGRQQVGPQRQRHGRGATARKADGGLLPIDRSHSTSPSMFRSRAARSGSRITSSIRSTIANSASRTWELPGCTGTMGSRWRQTRFSARAIGAETQASGSPHGSTAARPSRRGLPRHRRRRQTSGGPAETRGSRRPPISHRRRTRTTWARPSC